MLGTTYYHQTIRKYVAVFGTLFNDINVVRRDASDVINEQIKVPIAYSPRDRWVLRLRRARGESGTDEAVAMTLPRMGFELNGITYDPTRKLNTLGRVFAANTAASSSTLLKQYNSVPYNFSFNLFSMVSNAEDGAQIFEQIVPFFTPEFTVSVSLIASMNIKPDISTVCIGQAASMGSLLLTAGSKNKRYALPHSRIMVHQPSGGVQGQASDIQIHANEILTIRTDVNVSIKFLFNLSIN